MATSQPRLVHPDVDLDQVQIDPLRGFGEPVVRNVRMENIVELFRSGESPEGISEMYELEREAVLQALRYEFAVLTAQPPNRSPPEALPDRDR